MPRVSPRWRWLIEIQDGGGDSSYKEVPDDGWMGWEIVDEEEILRSRDLSEVADVMDDA